MSSIVNLTEFSPNFDIISQKKSIKIDKRKPKNSVW